MEERITPCLWFNGQAKEAAGLYCSVFEHTRIAAQSSIVTEITISGQSITLLDGGPMYQPNPSISFYCPCSGEKEFDRAWDLLGQGGSVLMPAGAYPWSQKFGWLVDRFGISWQLASGEKTPSDQKIIPCFLFTGEQYGRVEEAIAHYGGIFRSRQVDGIRRYGANESPDSEGRIRHAEIRLNGQKFMLAESALAQAIPFSEGVSLTIHCEDQAAVDHYWTALTEGGKESMCGWLKDKFGVSWQIIPTVLSKIMTDPAKAGKAAQAFMSMRKFDIEKLVQASLS